MRKLLTAIDRIVAETETLVSAQTTARIVSLAREQMTLQDALAVSRALNVPIIIQRGVTIGQFIREIGWVLPALESRPTLHRLSLLAEPILEEERAEKRRWIPKLLQEEVTLQRAERLRPETVRAKVREILLDRTSINLVEQTVFARLEMYLWLNFPLQVMQVLGKLLQQSITKQWYIERITGLEPLEKLMLQMYMQAFMEFPLSMNLLSLRVTPLTMSVLRHRTMSLYYTTALQKQELQQKSLLVAVQQRKQETKAVTSGKGRQEVIPVKENIGVTEDVTEDTTVGLGRNLFGRETMFTVLRYAYTIPFWIRRWLARSWGMPENHKYASYFGIAGIPSRRARTSWKTRRYDDMSGFLYSRDEKVMRYIRWREMHNIGTPYKGRYGAGRIWTHHSRRRSAMFPPYYTVP